MSRRWPLFLFTLACSEPQTSPPAPLEVFYGGCVDFRDETCHLEPVKPDALLEGLVLWTKAAPPLTITLDGEPIAPAQLPAVGGTQVTIPDAYGALQISVADRHGGQWTMKLSPEPPDPRSPYVLQKARLVRDLNTLWSEPLTPEQLAQMSAEQNVASPHDLLMQNIHWLVQYRLGLRAGLSRDTLQFSEQLLAVAEKMGSSRLVHHAWEMSRDARLSAGQIDDALVLSARLLAAAEAERSADALSEGNCAVERQITSHFWIVHQALLIDVDVDDSSVSADRQRSVIPLSPSCKNATEINNNALLNLASHALHSGDLEQAAIDLQGLDPEEQSTSTIDYAAWFTGRLTELRGLPEPALEQYEALLASPALEPLLRWQVHTAQARIHQTQGRPELAITAYRSAVRDLIQQSFQIPAHLGRDDFLASRERDIRQYLRLLLEVGRPDEAAEVVRILRGQYIYSLYPGGLHSSSEREHWMAGVAELRALGDALEQEQALAWTQTEESEPVAGSVRRWELDRSLEGRASDPLRPRPPADGELMLIYAPMDTGILSIALSNSTILVHETRSSVPDGATLFAPFQAEIDAADRISLLPYGALRGEDLHTLLLDGVPLAVRKSTAYVLDLPGAETLERAEDQHALLLVDPTQNLQKAREEGAQVARALETQHLPLTMFSGRQVTRQDALARMEGASLLHYAGHAEYSETPLDSAFLLWGDVRLSVIDLLTVQQPPALVVLSACESARSPDSAVEGLGLAQAMLLAGSQAVVATTRPVSDDLAAQFSAAFYQHPGFLSEPGAAFQSAAAALYTTDPDADWSAFRLLTP